MCQRGFFKKYFSSKSVPPMYRSSRIHDPKPKRYSKCDLKPQVKYISWPPKTKISFSAKTGENVEEAFLETARQIYQKIQEGSLELNAADSGVQTRQQETILFFLPYFKPMIRLNPTYPWINFSIFINRKIKRSNQIAADQPEKPEEKNCSC